MATITVQTMTKEDIAEQLKRHKKFLSANDGRLHPPAVFNHASLYNRNFSGINLSRARFHCAAFRRVNFSHANLAGANFERAAFDDVNFSDADLTGANFDGAYFIYANLENADMRGVSLEGTRFEHVLINENTKIFIPLRCPSSGSFIGWKKAHYETPESTEYYPHCIVKILVPEDARRSSAFGEKCRCDKAVILGAYDCATGCPLEQSIVIRSVHSFDFAYHIGDTITIPDFDDHRWVECSYGFHFFIDEESAKNYRW